MRNKKVWSVLLVGILTFALGMGTMALYTRTFTSSHNTVNSAKFKVSSNGTLDGDKKFEVPGKDLYPGAELDVYEFEIDKKDTEVPVKYTVSVIPEGRVFGERNGNPSPLVLSLFRKVDGKWEDMGALVDVELIPDNLVEEFKIHLEWPHNDEIDADFEDLDGNINIEVLAQQIDGEEIGDKHIEAKFNESILKNFGSVEIMELRGIEGAAKFRVQYHLNDKDEGRIPAWTDITDINKKTGLILYLPGDKVVIEIYTEDGETLLHTFTDVTLIRE